MCRAIARVRCAARLLDDILPMFLANIGAIRRLMIAAIDGRRPEDVEQGVDQVPM